MVVPVIIELENRSETDCEKLDVSIRRRPRSSMLSQGSFLDAMSAGDFGTASFMSMNINTREETDIQRANPGPQGGGDDSPSLTSQSRSAAAPRSVSHLELEKGPILFFDGVC